MNRFTCFLCLISLVAGLGVLVGCSRQYYRTKADREVYSILKKGNHDPRWKVDQPKITPDATSRMYDPFSPDKEPMPSDDPAAHQKMHRVGGMDGASDWHTYGQTSDVENPNWRHHLLVNEKGEIPLDKERAVELSILHSPEYQSARENLYLAAARVSQERFRYDVQFFGGDSLLYTAAGKLRGEGGQTLQNNANIEASKLLASGGEWVVGLANSITWQLSGQSSWQADSLFNISFVQPLLRGASRKVVLENLTQYERDFLTALRQMVFYQQGHYTRVVTGSGRQNAPSGSSSASIPSVSGGFYGLLAEHIRIQNQRQNIVGLEENLSRFIHIFEAGQIQDRSQVAQTQQSLLNAQSNLLRGVNSYQANIETYVRSLGLPPDLKISIDDPLLEQFQLTSPSIINLQEEVADLLAQIRTKDQPLPDNFRERVKGFTERTKSEIAVLEEDMKTLQTSMPERIASLKNLESTLAARIAEGERFDPAIYDTKTFEDRIQVLQTRDISRTLSRLQGLFVLLEVITNSDEAELRKKIQDNSFEPEAIKALEDLNLNVIETASTEEDIAEKGAELEKTNEELKELERTYNIDAEKLPTEEVQKVLAELRQKDDYRDLIRRVVSTFQYELISLALMQTRTRLDSMTLLPVSITPKEAFQTASENRLDWMNRKSQLVDSWRQIDITADRLKGDLGFTFNGEVGTVDRRGVHFADDNSRLQVGLAWDSPLTRHNEMLDYRRSQIAYQNTRRNYYTYVDTVQAELLNILRDVQMRRVEFEINRNAVLVGATRVDIMQLRMEQPPARGTDIDTNLSRDLIEALNGLMDSQNSLLETWVNYQTQRMILDLNLGTMKLDERGFWIDPGEIGAESNDTPQLAPLPVPVLEIPRLNRRYVEE